MTADERHKHLIALRDDLTRALRQAEAELEPAAAECRPLSDRRRRLKSLLRKLNELLSWLQTGNDPDPNSYPL
jgi:chromosome segregation ATPase